ncbi:MAG TPA: alpha/beta fold hydrolase [Gaiellaceae bacterium]|nr:alpha/beta fold hydrolase [Gaiellaceae bacterium]
MTVVALHGAGSGPWIFDDWQLDGCELDAVDLHAGLRVAAASMLNYEAEAARACDGVARPLALLGWSMGGLVAMMAARRVEPDALVLLEPSPAGESARFDEDVVLEEGTYDPEQAYGPFPPGVRARAESSLARAERRRGVSVPSLPSRTLVAYGDEFAQERGVGVARCYAAEELHVPGLDHWGLVRDPGVQGRVAGWLAAQVMRSTA